MPQLENQKGFFSFQQVYMKPPQTTKGPQQMPQTSKTTFKRPLKRKDRFHPLRTSHGQVAQFAIRVLRRRTLPTLEIDDLRGAFLCFLCLYTVRLCMVSAAFKLNSIHCLFLKTIQNLKEELRNLYCSLLLLNKKNATPSDDTSRTLSPSNHQTPLEPSDCQ